MKKDTIIAKDKTHLRELIEDCIIEHRHESDLNHIDTSSISYMSRLFAYSQFKGNISEWKVSNVKDMSRIFCKSQFEGDISHWNVSKIVNMSGMFAN